MEEVSKVFSSTQEKIISKLYAFDPNSSQFSDDWSRNNGGGGKTRAFAGGNHLEKGGINFSDVKGDTLPPSAITNRPDLDGASFRAMGVSIVFHPFNPYVPTAHANIRFFSAMSKSGVNSWWFGGGFDLTPYYPFREDVVFWHQQAKKLCDRYKDGLYQKFKKQCDQYFYLPHRNETRGVGGIFFDDLKIDNFDKTLSFCGDVISIFGDSYFSIFEKRKDTPFQKQEKDFQKYRRGRYAEFNLVYDRGTLFGLQSGGRTESILMSMPPEVTWTYNWNPSTNSKESELYEHFLKPVDWLE